jgi:hypothetical protein
MKYVVHATKVVASGRDCHDGTQRMSLANHQHNGGLGSDRHQSRSEKAPGRTGLSTATYSSVLSSRAATRDGVETAARRAAASCQGF